MANKIVGFTGSRRGMTDMQYSRVASILRELKPTHTIDGMCVGSDAEFAEIARNLNIRTMGYPGYSKSNPNDMQYRDTEDRAREIDSKPYLDRNRDIVDDSDIIIAAPKNDDFKSKSGTNYTIRYAIEQGVELHIVLPEGQTLREVDQGDK